MNSTGEFLENAIYFVGGGATLGGMAGFVAWALYESVTAITRRWFGFPESEEKPRDRMGAFGAFGGGIASVGGFVLLLIEKGELL